MAWYVAKINLSAGPKLRCKAGDKVDLDPSFAEAFVSKGYLVPTAHEEATVEAEAPSLAEAARELEPEVEDDGSRRKRRGKRS